MGSLDPRSRGLRRRGKRDFWPRALVILGLLALSACRGAHPPEPYVRLAGKAPDLPEAPAARSRLLVFWATWCPSCREETDELIALARKPPRNLAVVVISEDEDAAVVERFFGGPPPAPLNLRRDPGGSIASAFGARILPVTFLTVDGELRARFDGARQWDSRMRATLERILAH